MRTANREPGLPVQGGMYFGLYLGYVSESTGLVKALLLLMTLAGCPATEWWGE